jgi:hypothetical protein
MSDGPHRSLPMSRGWRRLAKFAENANFDRVDTCAAATHALSTTWRNEVPAAIVKGIRDVFLEREPGLFCDMRLTRIDAVIGDNAGYGLGRMLGAHASSVLSEGLTGEAGLAEATRRTLDTYSARATRQIEEHYCREASARLTRQVRERIGEAMGTADLDTLARHCAGLDPRARRSSVRRHTNIDEGVALS